jgi:hypothetical protein
MGLARIVLIRASPIFMAGGNLSPDRLDFETSPHYNASPRVPISSFRSAPRGCETTGTGTLMSRVFIWLLIVTLPLPQITRGTCRCGQPRSETSAADCCCAKYPSDDELRCCCCSTRSCPAKDHTAGDDSSDCFKGCRCTRTTIHQPGWRNVVRRETYRETHLSFALADVASEPESSSEVPACCRQTPQPRGPDPPLHVWLCVWRN